MLQQEFIQKEKKEQQPEYAKDENGKEKNEHINKIIRYRKKDE